MKPLSIISRRSQQNVVISAEEKAKQEQQQIKQCQSVPHFTVPNVCQCLSQKHVCAALMINLTVMDTCVLRPFSCSIELWPQATRFVVDLPRNLDNPPVLTKLYMFRVTLEKWNIYLCEYILSAKPQIQTSPICCVHFTYRRRLVILWRCCNTLCTSGLVDNVVMSYFS